MDTINTKKGDYSNSRYILKYKGIELATFESHEEASRFMEAHDLEMLNDYEFVLNNIWYYIWDVR